MADRPVVAVTHRVFDETIALLNPHCDLRLNQTDHTLERAEVLERCADAYGIMAFMPDWVDDGFLQACPKLRIVAGALKGYDNFDVDACSRHGVWMTIVPDLLTAPTADLTVGLLLGLSRHILAGDEHVRSAAFVGWQPVFYGTGLAAKTIGIIGLGKLGRAIADRLAGFDAQLIGYDVRADRSAPQAGRAEVAQLPLSDVIAQAGILILATPLTRETRHLISADEIARMPQGALLINTARGSVVDEGAVARALEGGELGGYAADVFEFEDWALPGRPPEISPRLLALKEKTLFTPHLGSAAVEVRKAIEATAARNILQVLAGEAPADAVNDIRIAS